ncbi:ATP-binding cassette domain-containing protein [uncultured Campylobacter sp.]|mgnify:CR=1 FL=1|uniref:ATP-binding cassette domain-containing protein n=1 Tax=uncultured Campylobacter sp. TaxID=218934 RepID=UPI00261ECBBE|nr:ATP-binding cassette domain-containing protein [uncultured Campylobacter sp.]
MSLLSVSGLSHSFVDFSFFGKAREKPVLQDVSFEIERGEALGLLGKSAGGKSTIAKIISGLLKPSAGEIKFEGKEPDFSSLAGRRAFYRSVQIVFQDSIGAVNPRFSVREIIEEPLLYLSERSREQRRERALSLLEKVELKSELLDKRASMLSGGQLQRVCIAAVEPKLIILDEALSSLDTPLQSEILKLLQALKGQSSFLFITHDIRLARLFCEHIILLDRGRIAQSVRSGEKFTSEIGRELEDAVLPPFPLG